MAWINEHLACAYSPRPLLDVAAQLTNIASLSQVVDSHRPQLQRILNAGHQLLLRRGNRRCDVLPPSHQCPWRSYVETQLAQLDVIWRQLETVVRQQKERLDSLSATDPERQVSSHYSS